MFLSGWFKKHEPLPNAERLRVLLVSMSLEDRFLIERLSKQHGWALWSLESEGRIQTRVEERFRRDFVRSQSARVSRRGVLDRLFADAPRSCVLLVSPSNDEYLWREVIQHGGYDVVTHPLREESVPCD